MVSVSFGKPEPCKECELSHDCLGLKCPLRDEWGKLPRFFACVPSSMMGAELALSLLSYMRDEGISSDGYRFEIHRW